VFLRNQFVVGVRDGRSSPIRWRRVQPKLQTGSRSTAQPEYPAREFLRATFSAKVIWGVLRRFGRFERICTLKYEYGSKHKEGNIHKARRTHHGKSRRTRSQVLNAVRLFTRRSLPTPGSRTPNSRDSARLWLRLRCR
jgi:hypothetical protein